MWKLVALRPSLFQKLVVGIIVDTCYFKPLPKCSMFAVYTKWRGRIKGGKILLLNHRYLVSRISAPTNWARVLRLNKLVPCINKNFNNRVVWSRCKDLSNLLPVEDYYTSYILYCTEWYFDCNWKKRATLFVVHINPFSTFWKYSIILTNVLSRFYSGNYRDRWVEPTSIIILGKVKHICNIWHTCSRLHKVSSIIGGRFMHHCTVRVEEEVHCFTSFFFPQQRLLHIDDGQRFNETVTSP